MSPDSRSNDSLNPWHDLSLTTRDWLGALARHSLGDFDLTRALDADLSARAVAARTDERVRDDLFVALAMKARRFCVRFQRWNLHPYAMADVYQEAYLAYLDVLRAWRPLTTAPHDTPAGFGYYFFAVYPRRLADRVRALQRPRRHQPDPLPWQPEIDIRVDSADPAGDVETAAIMAAICGRLNAADATLFQLRSSGALSIDDAAQQAGISRRTLYRRWPEIARIAREELEQAG
jgi:DNA-directed RNA polymerase specialized sigma24 family protein